MIVLLSDKVYEGAVNIPVIMIVYHDNQLSLSGYEALVFSSKNAVYALSKTSDTWRDIPAYAIGTATAQAIQDLGGTVVYTAKNSYGDDFAQEIKRRLQGKRVLFPRAKVVTSSLNEILKEAGVLLEEAILYETRCCACESLEKPPKNAIVIFSSPSTIKCFFHCFTWDESYQAVVIGTRTASAMPKEIPFHLSSQQDIPSCILLAQKLSKKPL